MSIEFNADDLVQGLQNFAGEFLKAAERGGGKAGSALLNDTIMEMPAVPLDEGTLRGSGSVLVQNNLVQTAPNVGGTPTPATEGDESLAPDMVIAVVGFNTPYAAVQHEGQREDGTHIIKNYTHAGTGKKFLERKLFNNADDYIKVAAEEVKGFMGNA